MSTGGVSQAKEDGAVSGGQQGAWPRVPATVPGWIIEVSRARQFGARGIRMDYRLHRDLRLQPWVVFIEGPPKPDTPPSQMIKYLTRYLTGGPISNSRIVGEAGRPDLLYGSEQEKGLGSDDDVARGGGVRAAVCVCIFCRKSLRRRGSMEPGAARSVKCTLSSAEAWQGRYERDRVPNRAKRMVSGKGERKTESYPDPPEAHADAFIAKNRCGAWWWSVARVGGSCSMVRIIQAGLSGQAEGCGTAG